MDFTYTISADEVMCTKRAIRNSDLIVIISIPKKYLMNLSGYLVVSNSNYNEQISAAVNTISVVNQCYQILESIIILFEI